jgi:hypothetical protein
MTRILVCLSLLAVFAGCGGPDATVQGSVTIDGQLARRGTVVFHPVDGGPAAYGSIADNGSYALRVGQGENEDAQAEIDSGQYIVTAVVNMPSQKDQLMGDSGPPAPGARITAIKYAAKETSDLRVTVKPGPNVVPLDLKGASGDESIDAGNTDAATDAELPGQSGEERESIMPPAETASSETPGEPVETEGAASEVSPLEQTQ